MVSCVDCRYWYGQRTCRRYPEFISRMGNEWCGEFAVIEKPVVYACSCGDTFATEHGLKSHVGRKGGRHGAA